RCQPIEGSDDLFESLKRHGVQSLRQLAFAIGSPQVPRTEEALKELTGKLYGCSEAAPATVGQIANIRMLIFEASTLVVAQLRAQATTDDTDLTGRKLPHVEKQARLVGQKARLPGLLIEGELQPSYALVDACALMSESNSVTWISPSRCTKRDAEVQQLGKERTSLVQIESGTLKVSANSRVPDADATTALQLLYCLQRRGLALDQCSLASWPDHEWYVQSLMTFLHAEPVAGVKPSVAQVIRADREAWTLMSRELEGSISAKNAAGELVMAAALRRLAKDPRVVVHLVAAAPSGGGGKGNVPPPPPPPNDAAAVATLADKKLKKRKRLSNLLPESLKGCVTKIKVEGTPSASSEALQASSDVESIAEHILNGPRPFTNQSLLSLVDTLPMQGPARGNVGRSFAAGAYVHGGLFGLHNNTRRFPKACSVFAEHLRSMAPKDNFTSFVVSDNCCAEVHRDSNNDETRDNILVKISDFSKGEVWLEGPGNVEMFDAEGNSFMGSAIPWDGNILRFNARCSRHATLPWTGRRVVLIGYSMRHSHELNNADANFLIDLGFAIGDLVASPSEVVGPSPPNAEVDPARSRSPKALAEKVSCGHLGEYVLIELHGRTADLHKATLKAGLRHILCNPPTMFVPGVRGLPLDLGNEAEGVVQLLDAEKARVALLWCELPSQPCSSFAANLCTVCEFAFDHQIPLTAPLVAQGVQEFITLEDTRAQQSTFEGRLAMNALFVVGPLDPALDDEFLLKDFLQRAVQAGHPRDGNMHVSKLVVQAIQANFIDPPSQTANERAKTLKQWTERAKQLESKEEQLHSSLPEHLKPLLKGKRLLLWQEMNEAAGSPDDKLITHMCEGFRLTGWLSQGSLFSPKVRPPSFSVETLRCMSQGLNKATLQKMHARQDEDLELATWQETEKELEKGWIFATTYSCQYLCALARRFGIRQLEKVRVIDDASICGINATVGLKYGFQMHSIDRYAAWITKALKMCGGRLPACKGRVFDLKSAYKQFGVHEFDRKIFRLAVNKPGAEEPLIMGVNSLPFGAVGSVAAFLRISLSLWLIGTKLFKIFWTAFFDDYGVTTRDELVDNTAACVGLLFELLGVDYAKEGKKAPPFSREFKLLGVRVDLHDAPKGVVKIGNTPERREELLHFIEGILRSNKLDLKTAERLRGRLVFFEGFVFGRASNSAMRTVDRAARDGKTANGLSPEVQKCLKVLRQRLMLAEPVEISDRCHKSWLIFTDGACEGKDRKGSVGGVLIGLNGHPISFFSEVVPKPLMNVLLRDSKNPIFELELLPVLLAYKLWGRWCKSAQAIFYIDNEGARHAIIAAGGGSDHARVIIDGILFQETSLQVRSWYSTLPTHSNLADAPSRGDCASLLQHGCSRVFVNWEDTMRQCFPMG
ncbi:dnajb6-b, partial [Symbiodinium microadriaticum]